VKWPARPSVEVTAGIRDCERRLRIHPLSRFEHYWGVRVGRISLVGKVQCCGAFAADHERPLVLGIEEVEQLLRPGLNRQYCRRRWAVDPHWPSSAQ
jgi:hypothetical protein